VEPQRVVRRGEDGSKGRERPKSVRAMRGVGHWVGEERSVEG